MKDKYAKTKKYRKVRDTCHYTDQYRGALHNICKLKYSMYEQIIVIFTQHVSTIIISTLKS